MCVERPYYFISNKCFPSTHTKTLKIPLRYSEYKGVKGKINKSLKKKYNVTFLWFLCAKKNILLLYLCVCLFVSKNEFFLWCLTQYSDITRIWQQNIKYPTMHNVGSKSLQHYTYKKYSFYVKSVFCLFSLHNFFYFIYLNCVFALSRSLEKISLHFSRLCQTRHF